MHENNTFPFLFNNQNIDCDQIKTKNFVSHNWSTFLSVSFFENEKPTYFSPYNLALGAFMMVN